ncbi:MAG: FkbM family methyltransferase [Nostoc sp.]|uniref:FkbM family methyltransferase n=1 Tax=Nostoc sp. TaxID=1180 RepID=UPI002FF10FBF
MKKKLELLRRKVYEVCGNSKYSRPSLNNLDTKLEKYLNFSNGFFIEVGANDGYSQSNTYYLEKFLGWRGILVEPIPYLFNKCKRTRSNSSVYNYALVSQELDDSFVEMHYANLMSVVEGSLKSQELQAKHIEDGLKCQKIAKSYTVSVPTKTLESILNEFPYLPTIDFLSLDVEGYEINVLLGLNLHKYKPRYILIEARFFEEIQALLEPFYNLVEQLSYHDFLYQIKN